MTSESKVSQLPWIARFGQQLPVTTPVFEATDAASRTVAKRGPTRVTEVNRETTDDE